MANPFKPVEFIERIARQLVFEFDDAAQAGTPGLIGYAREHPARKKFELLLPHASAIGSGLVIDSFGGASRQQDIVIHERLHCPIFSINETPEATYYPCEGEVKSSVGSKELEDAFEKLSSVKRLRRYAVPSTHEDGLPPAIDYRYYGNSNSFAAVRQDQYDQNAKWTDQIFGFVLCGNFSLSHETLVTRAAELWGAVPAGEAPNLLLSLNDGFLQPMNGQLLPSALGASRIAFCKQSEKGFVLLLRRLLQQIRSGRTVDLKHFGRYLFPPDVEDTFALAAISPILRR
jgi:Domain of unknown function (DUF6602)